MRTTVEITDLQRAELLRLAAERGEKGFSGLVREAIDLYLTEVGGRRERALAAQRVLGTLDEEAADDLEASVGRLRERWR